MAFLLTQNFINMTRLTNAFSIVLVAIIPCVTNAQKRPSIQQNSLLAPANIKIDARLNEWGDTFQAYNNTTDVFYTMANDDQNLYLVIKSADQMNNNKIMAGGINFTVNTAGKKQEKDAYTLVFPLVSAPGFGGGGQIRSVTVMRPPGGGDNIRMDMAGPGGGMPGPPDSATIAARRKKAISALKEMKLLGFTADIADTTISIYNEYGIKVALDYDAKGSLVYEMAIPLKYLHLSTDKPKEFAYNIKLNGINLSAMMPPGAVVMVAPPPGGGGDAVRMDMGGGGGMPGRMQAMISPTDFWGKYTLAKK